MSNAAQRWQAFLAQIKERHAAVCAEAEEGTRAAIDECGHDFTPISHAWMAITNRLQDLERKIIDTWSEKVEDAFEAEGVDAGMQARERRKGEDLAFELENRREEAEMRGFAYGAQVLHGRAVQTQRESNCAHCGAKLNVPLTYRALNIPCTHCNSLNSFEPGMHARMAVAAGGHAMARQQAHGEWLAMRNAERAIRDVRSPTPLALLKAFERAQIEYWWKYLGARANFEPELHDVPHEVRSRMQFWWTQMEGSEEEWRKAGNPRASF